MNATSIIRYSCAVFLATICCFLIGLACTIALSMVEANLFMGALLVCASLLSLAGIFYGIILLILRDS